MNRRHRSGPPPGPPRRRSAGWTTRAKSGAGAGRTSGATSPRIARRSCPVGAIPAGPGSEASPGARRCPGTTGGQVLRIATRTVTILIVSFMCFSLVIKVHGGVVALGRLSPDRPSRAGPPLWVACRSTRSLPKRKPGGTSISDLYRLARVDRATPGRPWDEVGLRAMAHGDDRPARRRRWNRRPGRTELSTAGTMSRGDGSTHRPSVPAW